MENLIKRVKIYPTGHYLFVLRGELEFILDSISQTTNDSLRDSITKSYYNSECFVLSNVTDDLVTRFFFVCRDDVSTPAIVHESYHLLNMIFEKIGYVQQQGDELEAYMIEHIFEELQTALNEED